MLMMLFAIWSPDDAVAACRSAVHGDLATAITACAVPKERIDLTSPAGLDERCRAALAAGYQAGRFGPGLPAKVRDGLIREFDKKEAECRAPAAPETPTRNVTQLWN